MFNLEKAVHRWRKDLERETSLSPGEVDELEDHLRARFDLELELDAGMAPARAFGIVRHELGQGPALAREFEKARKPTWRRWLVTGWALFAGSFFMPVAEGWLWYEVYWNHAQHWPAHQVIWDLLPVLTMLLTLPALLGLHLLHGRSVRWLLTGVGLWSVENAIDVAANGLSWFGFFCPPPGAVTIGIPPPPGFTPPYVWAWSLSFVCTAAGLWLRDRQRARTAVEKSTA